MPDTARALLTAALLSGSALAALTLRLQRTDPDSTERVVGELHVMRWIAVILAATGALTAGLAVARATPPMGALEVTIGVAFIAIAGVTLAWHPRQGLLISAGAFVLHALVDIAHRPGLLSPEIAPRWFTVGCAIYDVYVAAVCYWAQRR